MSRYIDAEKINFEPIDITVNGITHRTVERMATETEINAIPTADVEEVKHGKWEHGREVHREYIGDALIGVYYDKWWCSQCHYTIDDHHYSKITYKRCPECGAHMDKEKEE